MLQNAPKRLEKNTEDKMKKPALFSTLSLVLALSTGCFSPADAADVVLSWTPSGALDLKAQITTPNGCYFSHAAKPGTPDEVPRIENLLAITLPVDAKGNICPQEITVLDYHLTIATIPRDTAAIIVYETWPQGQMVKAKAYPLPPRKAR
jgi:hypothetical protein